MFKWVHYFFFAAVCSLYAAPSTLTFQQFQAAIQSPKIVVIDVYSPWCGPCRRFEPIFSQASETFSKKCSFFKVNADEEKDLVRYLNVTAYPTTLFFKEGVEVGRQLGYMNSVEFSSQIRQFQ